MPDAKTLLTLPLQDFRGALWQPLCGQGLIYRHEPARKKLPWVRSRPTTPMTHHNVVEFLSQVKHMPCRIEWLEAWADAADNWLRSIEPTAWGYIRVSHKISAESGLSLEWQVGEILRYWRQRFEPKGVELGPIFNDPGLSCRYAPMRTRRGGGQLFVHPCPGDHIIFARLDRGLRSVKDAAQCLEDYWKPRNITPHFLDLRVDLSTSAGRAMFYMATVMSESEWEWKSERARATVASLRRRGLPTNQHAPTGWTTKRVNGRRVLVADEKARAVAQEVVRLHDEENLDFAKISDRIERALCEYEGRAYKKSAWVPRLWNRDRCARAYEAWKLTEGFTKLPYEDELIEDAG